MGLLEIAEATGADGAAWEDFLDESTNGTLFHSLRFLSYHEPGKAEPHPLVFRDSGRILAVLPGGVVEEDRARVFASPWGGSFGGWAVRGDERLEEIERLVDGLLDWCRGQRLDAIRLTLPPIFYLREPSQQIEFVLTTRGFRRVGCEITDVIPLEGGAEGVQRRWLSSARKALRKAHSSGVVVRDAMDLGLFYPLLKENRERHGVRPTHSLGDLERLCELVPERLKLLLAEREGRPVGGTLLFVCNPRVVMDFYLCHTQEAEAWRPSDALVAAAIDESVEMGAAFFDLGTSSLAGEVNVGLHRFKGKFGARPFLRETYRRDLETS